PRRTSCAPDATLHFDRSVENHFGGSGQGDVCEVLLQPFEIDEEGIAARDLDADRFFHAMHQVRDDRNGGDACPASKSLFFDPAFISTNSNDIVPAGDLGEIDVCAL